MGSNQTHFLLLFVNKKYPEAYILLWKGGWFWLFTHFANKKLFIAAKCVKSQNHPPFYTINIQTWTLFVSTCSDILPPVKASLCKTLKGLFAKFFFPRHKDTKVFKLLIILPQLRFVLAKKTLKFTFCFVCRSTY